jgi:outer membrane protein assembly factor BamB
VFGSPTVVGDAVILGSCSGTLYALDRTTGSPIWFYDTGEDGAAAQFHGEPLLIGDRIVIPSDADPKGHLYSFDTKSGDLVWKLPFLQGVAATPLLIDGRLVAISALGEVVAVHPRTGDVLWKEVPAGALKPQPFILSPAFSANTAKLFALDASTGATVWRKALPARTNTALVVVGDMLVLGTEDGYMNWIALASGDVKKRIRLEEGHPYGTPILASPLLFVLTSGAKGSLIALDARSGAVKWKQQTPKEWTTYRPLVTGSTVIVGREEKDLCAFDRSSGERRWCRSVGQIPRGLGISSDGILYVGSLSGVVQAFRIGAAGPTSNR